MIGLDRTMALLVSMRAILAFLLLGSTPGIVYGEWWPSFWPNHRPQFSATQNWDQLPGATPATEFFVGERYLESRVRGAVQVRPALYVQATGSRVIIDQDRTRFTQQGFGIFTGHAGELRQGIAGLSIQQRLAGNQRWMIAPQISVSRRSPGLMAGIDYVGHFQRKDPVRVSFESYAGYWQNRNTGRGLSQWGITPGIGVHYIMGGQGSPPEPLGPARPLAYSGEPSSEGQKRAVPMEELATAYPFIRTNGGGKFWNATASVMFPFTYLRTQEKVGRTAVVRGRFSGRAKGTKVEQQYFNRLEAGSPALSVSLEGYFF